MIIVGHTIFLNNISCSADFSTLRYSDLTERPIAIFPYVAIIPDISAMSSSILVLVSTVPFSSRNSVASCMVDTFHVIIIRLCNQLYLVFVVCLGGIKCIMLFFSNYDYLTFLQTRTT